MPAKRAASLTAFCRLLSCRWWRRITPLRGSIDITALGNTHCQPQARGALGYFIDSASGSQTCNGNWPDLPTAPPRSNAAASTAIAEPTGHCSDARRIIS